VKGEFIMRRFALVIAAAGLVSLTACGTTVTGRAVPAHAGTVTDLSYLVASRTAAEHTVHITYDATTSIGELTGTGQAEFTPGKIALQLDVTTPVGAIGMVLVGDKLYLKIPQSVAHTGKPWIGVDPNGTDPTSKALAAVLSEEQANADPSRTLAQIQAAGTITRTSADQVDGRPATHYAISVNTAKLLASSAVTPQLRQLISGSAARLPATIGYDVWIDSAGLPVKIAFNENVTGAKTTITMTYSQWGAPVSIQAPPADQIGALPGH
jgi:hypothetical protein